MVNTVTLCGSVKFLSDFNLVNAELTKRGMSVFSIGMALDSTQQREEAHVKELLDLVHFNKILRSDAIIVVGDGYIGFSTAREILWAEMQGKPSYWLPIYTAHGQVNWRSLLTDIANGEDNSPQLTDAATKVLLDKAKAEYRG